MMDDDCPTDSEILDLATKHCREDLVNSVTIHKAADFGEDSPSEPSPTINSMNFSMYPSGPSPGPNFGAS